MIKKEDRNAISDASKEANKLSQIIANVESKQESETERFKKELEKLIPQLSQDVDNLIESSTQPQYLSKESDMQEMIKQLDEKWDKFQQMEDTQ